MARVNYNGLILPASTPIVDAANRGLRYGDGVFETMKYCNGSLVLQTDHFERLWFGLEKLQFSIPKSFNPPFLADQVQALLAHEGLTYARVRLSVVRGSGGLYDLSHNSPNFIIEASALEPESVNYEGEGARIGLFEDAKKMADSYSPIKHNNYLPYCMAAIYAKQQGLHDALLLNQHGRICDSTMANIYIVKNKTITTPPLDEGCVAGIIRKNLLATLPTLGFKIKEGLITKKDVVGADELFLTNSILNLRPVSTFEDKSYSTSFTSDLFTTVQTKTELFC